MSLSLPSDPANPPPVATPPDASKAQPPILRRLVNGLSFWFYLPQNYIALVAAYTQMAEQSLRQAQLLHYQSTKLKFYEENVPWLGDLHKRFVAENAGSDMASLADGVLIPANGDKRRRVISLS